MKDTSKLPQCCLDFDITADDLLTLPAKLSDTASEFISAHGISRLTLTELQATLTKMPNGVYKVKHRCAMLLNDGTCSIYLKRPQICREFDCKARSDCDCKGSGVCLNSRS